MPVLDKQRQEDPYKLMVYLVIQPGLHGKTQSKEKGHNKCNVLHN